MGKDVAEQINDARRCLESIFPKYECDFLRKKGTEEYAVQVSEVVSGEADPVYRTEGYIGPEDANKLLDGIMKFMRDKGCEFRRHSAGVIDVD